MQTGSVLLSAIIWGDSEDDQMSQVTEPKILLCLVILTLYVCRDQSYSPVSGLTPGTDGDMETLAYTVTQVLSVLRSVVKSAERYVLMY